MTTKESQPIAKRSIVIGGHKTSISLEQQFWDSARDIARLRHQSISKFMGEIDASRAGSNLSSTVRVFVLDWYKHRASAPPHVTA